MQNAAATTDARETRTLGLAQNITLIIGKYGALIVLALLFTWFSITAQYFLTWDNFVQIFNQAALSAIVACGLTMVLASNQFDLSTGNTASLAGIVVSGLMINGFPIPVAIAAALAVGVVIGLCNSFLVTRLGVNALVATLGVGSAAVGVNYFLSGGAAQPFAFAAPGFTQISIGNFLGIPKNVYYMVLIVGVLWVLLNRTVMGRDIQAVGGNAEAARLAGVGVRSVTSAAFVICALCAAVTGILLAAVVGSGQPTGGDGYTLSAFAACTSEIQYEVIGRRIMEQN
jgi:ribose transport system permease protein